MKKSFSWAVCLLTALCLTAFLYFVPAAKAAEDVAATPFSTLYRAGELILTGTDNVTARGEADFLLDGKLFKHAEGLCAQEECSSYQQIDLQSPRADGSMRENGYAVADFSGQGYSVERYLGKTVYQQTVNVMKDRVLRPRVASEALLSLWRQAAGVLDSTGSAQVSVSESGTGTKVSISWAEGDVPGLVHPVLTLFYQQAVTRYFQVGYADMPVSGYASVEDYLTPTQGLLYCVKDLTLTGFQAEAELDGEKRLTRLSGLAQLSLLCRDESSRALEIRFSLDVSNYGTTVVKDLIPEENREENLMTQNVSGQDAQSWFGTMAGGGASWTDVGLPDIPLFASSLDHRTLGSPEEASDYAAEIAAMDSLGVGNPERLVWSVHRTEEGYYEATGAWAIQPDEPILNLLFTESGHVLSLRNLENGYDLAEDYEGSIGGWDMDSDTLVAWRQELGVMLWMFEENLNPGATLISDESLRDSLSSGAGYGSYDHTSVFGEQIFVTMYANLYRDPYAKVKYVVQTSPFLRVILRDETIDPEEGGNG